MIDFNTQIFWVNECESKWAPTLSKRGGGHPREVHKVGNWALDMGISGTVHWAEIAQIITIQAPRKLGIGYGNFGHRTLGRDCSNHHHSGTQEIGHWIRDSGHWAGMLCPNYHHPGSSWLSTHATHTVLLYPTSIENAWFWNTSSNTHSASS